SDTAQIRRWGHAQLPTYGRLKDRSKREIQAMLQSLIRHGYLRQDGLRYPVLALTAQGREVMHDREHAKLGVEVRPPSPKKRPRDRIQMPSESEPANINGELAGRLRAWRLQKSKQMGVPPYTIFWDRTLNELAARRPAALEELRTIWGIGEQKR